jgi:hypothetical protein
MINISVSLSRAVAAPAVSPHPARAFKQRRRVALMSWFIMPFFLATSMTDTALGQQLFIYPSQGQTPEQQNRDRYECHTWAVQQTGVDPTRPQTAYVPPPPQQEAQQGGLLRGAGRGAAIGAVGGAIGGDAGKGAAIGAASGALIGGFRRRDQRRRQEQQQQNYQAQVQSAQAAQANQIASYNRALAACLNGRGYQVR